MRILIIEDEAIVSRNLEKLIRALEPDAETLAILSSVRMARSWLASHPAPDLVFADIHLSDGLSFEVFEQLPVSSPIIFTTAYNEFAIRAFKLNSVDYLLKPVDRDELKRALQKYKHVASGRIFSEQMKSLMSHWEGKGARKFKERFLTVHRNTLVPVADQQVAFFHKDELVYLHTLENEKLISEHHTLDEIEGLVNPEQYFRVNRQYIIHLQAVDRVKTTHKGLAVQLKPPLTIELEVSREKAGAFKKWLG